MASFRPSRWHFNIDKHINPILPASVLPQIPYPVAHFLGHRSPPPQRPVGNLTVIFWAFIGIFSSLTIIGTVSARVPSFKSHNVPQIIGSFGAAAVLDFYAIESPLAQPRNTILGQLISSFVGISIGKLFALSPHFESIRWLGAALSCATATAAMGLTGTVHPPAGATALMAVMNDDVMQLGWFLIPAVELGVGLMLTMALMINNIQRRFPFYWWSPEETGGFWHRRRQESKTIEALGASINSILSDNDTAITGAASSSIFRDTDSSALEKGGGGDRRLVITRDAVHIPNDMYVTAEEKTLLETLCQRL
ncbi:HPP family-domain-containing protein [Podospora didyma]|uniref:HPP family-domain-containing protein n=1 Tax=Podospora didyma TaxID=330526 RepID=A0AAE0KEK8_9PEZI|nr:HPP family-domain-containing protein [Podospora didyma]